MEGGRARKALVANCEEGERGGRGEGRGREEREREGGRGERGERGREMLFYGNLGMLTFPNHKDQLVQLPVYHSNREWLHNQQTQLIHRARTHTLIYPEGWTLTSLFGCL